MVEKMKLEEGNKINSTPQSSKKTVLFNGSTLRQTIQAPQEVSKSGVKESSGDAKK